MKQIFISIIVIGLLGSCRSEIKSNHIYEEIIEELISNSYLMPLNAPPQPFLVDKNDGNEISRLKGQLFFMENKIQLLHDFIMSEHTIMILEKYLPANPEFFVKAYSGATDNMYDTTWIGNIDDRHTNRYKSVKSSKLNVYIPNYRIEYIHQIPEPDTSLFSLGGNSKIDIHYLQLSEILLNETENRGIFYYSISSKGNLHGYMKYGYIERKGDAWTMIKK